MYLRKYRRRKDGKVHAYWGLVESVRLAGKPRQRLVAHLGELDDKQCAPYAELVRSLNAQIRGEADQADLFEEGAAAAIVPGKVSVERTADFGDAWMGLMLWRVLELEEFFCGLIKPGREKVSWPKMIAWSAIARFCCASSELSLADDFADRSALCDLLGVDVSRINDDRLYRTLDEFAKHKAALMKHLAGRYRDLFASEQDLVLYDLTSTYFEGQAQGNAKARHGYSRDGRPDAKQVVIAMVTTREGLPLACEVFRGNRHDSTTLKTICAVMEKRFGSAQRVWVMDRGIASEDNLKWLRERGGKYLVGTPKSQLRRFEKHLLQAQWRQAREGVEVVLIAGEQGGGESYVLCRSRDRQQKEKAMIERFAQRLEEGLDALSQACSRKRNPVRDKLLLGRRLGVLLKQNSRACSLFEYAVHDKPGGGLRFEWSRKSQQTWPELSAGCYLLRANLPSPLSPEQQWQAYIQLTEIESAFRCIKSELGVRPIYHQLNGRVSAHIQICFLALCMKRALGMRLEQWGLGASQRKLMQELKDWKQIDVALPLAGSDKVLRRRIISNPAPALKILLQRLLLPTPKLNRPIGISHRRIP